jgi:hypothetical protein
MISNFGYCRVSIAPIRSEQKDSAEMVTQLLFGEIVEVIETDRQWRKVRNVIDGYEGWVDEKLLCGLTEKEMKRWFDDQTPVYNSTLLIDSKTERLTLTRGAMVTSDAADQTFQIGNDQYTKLTKPEPIPQSIVDIALSYQNVPYLWGGRSNFGIDCSGFTQMIYRFKGYSLPRDAYQQAEDGVEIEYKEKQVGDLAYFTNTSGKITHVGMVLENNHIIHAHGRVIVDELRTEGIFSVEKQHISHKLFQIKRCL